MKKRVVVYLSLFLVLILSAGLAYAEGKKKGSSKRKPGDILYVCNCGDTCTCDTVMTKPGKCTCGQDLVQMHVLKIEGDETLLCTCGKGCSCKLDKDDPTKCGCGKVVKKVSIKGLYACGCSDGCMCNTVSDKPGKCRCGTQLKKV
ncbi:hypothetical protein [Candidatus Magnetominusculus xianensis]|uniref:Secreted protein n=1 Tax=Candidatus Magnetominusculus xianensis TaxID=1748249 RepID=A0ABR5SBT9_9BACT|nr:hypothetical protein [Candidatus Magnetominusculus xianensis]KWT78286.1 hypothetical protein ASN18_2891 [Candidatus Magnetominusculus xianensis]MBF0404025.1 hypothetical protein [Nitrospirota bacterium]